MMYGSAPLLALNMSKPRALKRAHSASGEQSLNKQPFVCEVPYDEIINGAMEKFLPLVYVCTDGREVVYEHQICGLNDLKHVDRNMTIVITCSRSLYGSFFYLHFRVFDARGQALKLWKLMADVGIPARREVACGGGQGSVRERLLRALAPWVLFLQSALSA